MEFLAYECVEAPIVARLRNDGHKVMYVAELATGITDDEVLALANMRLPPIFGQRFKAITGTF